jgi:hypothetical protein
MQGLTQEQILAALDREEVETKALNVPELGGTVWVRELPGNLRNRLEATYATIRGGGDSKSLDKVTAQIIATCTVDEGGKPILTMPVAQRILQSKPKAAFRIRDAVMDLSATDDEDAEALAEVFGDGPNGPSTSA